MNKKVVIAIIFAVVIVGAVGGYLWMKSSSKEVVTPVEEKTAAPTPVKKALSDTMKEYQDPAGFTFSYPDNLAAAPKELDSKTYSLFEITSPDATGSMTITVADSAFKTLADWEKKNKATDSATMSDAKLADLDAKELKTADGTTLIAIDRGGVLFTIAIAPKGQSELWQQVYDKVVSTFAFVSPEEQKETSSGTSSGASSGGDTVVEEEEVVE